ncbi:flippase-like domain-containing protein [Halomicroarcula sp. F13]|uniref:Flippase-like domain-containing protein n=1 Tax=Haloarcula rubra TaxID=2487747 RepID=A0AAW4PUA8_9EURY|nr:lysylphosphatidylglycerol synthase transmembrane domain-containing protein [Halomicroarcula rubra]MBX0324211.1 flippase-like domain-containing protein [Halomicroarcula rubra]
MTSDSAALDFADRRTVAQIVLGFAVAGLVVYLLVDFVGTADVVAGLLRADPGWMALACVSTALCLTAWGKAWQIVLGVAGIDESFSRLVVTYYAATFANYVTPLGQAGGEPFIAYVLSRDTEASYQDSLASVVTADLLNLFPFVTFAGVGFAALLYGSSLPEAIEPLAGGLVVLSVGVPVVAAVGWRFRKRLGKALLDAVAPLASRTPRVSLVGLRERLRETEQAFQRIARDRRALVQALLFSYVGWVFFALPLYFSAQAIGADLTLLLVFFVVPASTLAGLVPSPGGSGAVETALVVLLVALTSVGQTDATVVAILYRVASYVFALVLGGAAALYVLKRN